MSPRSNNVGPCVGHGPLMSRPRLVICGSCMLLLRCFFFVHHCCSLKSTSTFTVSAVSTKIQDHHLMTLTIYHCTANDSSETAGGSGFQGQGGATRTHTRADQWPCHRLLISSDFHVFLKGFGGQMARHGLLGRFQVGVGLEESLGGVGPSGETRVEK